FLKASLVSARSRERQWNECAEQRETPPRQFFFQALGFSRQKPVRAKLGAIVAGLNHFVEHFRVGLPAFKSLNLHHAPAHRSRCDPNAHGSTTALIASPERMASQAKPTSAR